MKCLSVMENLLHLEIERLMDVIMRVGGARHIVKRVEMEKFSEDQTE